MAGGISTNHSSHNYLSTGLYTGPRAFPKFWRERYESKYESSQHFPMGGYESVILKELHRLLQFKIYYKHGA